MAEARILTEQDILNANTYVPLGDKAVYARAIANLCVTEMKVSVKDGEKDSPLPNMAREDPKMKMLYGMWVMLHFYLGILDKEELTETEYDEWGRISIFNQIERFKASKNAEVKNRAFDIIDDYREFYRMVGCEINSILTARNDLLPRAIMFLTAQVTPEAIESLLGGLDEVKNKIDELKAKTVEN